MKKSELEISKKEFTDHEGNKYEFDFLFLDSADKWKAASDFSFICEINRLNDSKLNIPMHGISFADREEMESVYPLVKRLSKKDTMGNEIPESDQDFTARSNSLNAKRSVFLIERAIGKKIPGETLDEKVSFLSKRSIGEIDTLTDFAEVNCSAINSGNLVEKFTSLNLQPLVNEFKGFEEWEEASQIKSIFRFQRPTENFIVEIALRNISQEDKISLEASCAPPDAPRNQRKVVDGKTAPMHEWEPNYDDPTWKKSLAASQQKRKVMIFEKCLMFEIPGSNEHEKYKWLSSRLVGDIYKINRFIEQEICGYRSKYNFFLT